MSEYLKNLQEGTIIQHSFVRSGNNLTELNTGALKSLQHLLGNYKDQLKRMTHDNVDRPRVLKKIEGVKDKIDAVEKAGREAAQKARDTVVNKTAEVVDKTKEVADTVKDTVKDKAGAAVEKTREVADTAKDVAGDTASTAGTFISQNPGTTAAIAAAALTAGILAYRKFFSKGAQACKNAPDKKDCMKDLKKKAIGARIDAMNSGKAKCAGNEKCIAKIDAKTAALKSKMASM